MLFIFDGGKHGNSRAISQLLRDENNQSLKCHPRIVHIVKDEEGVTDRMSGVRRGVGSVLLDEHVHIFTIGPSPTRESYEGCTQNPEQYDNTFIVHKDQGMNGWVNGPYYKEHLAFWKAWDIGVVSDERKDIDRHLHTQ